MPKGNPEGYLKKPKGLKKPKAVPKKIKKRKVLPEADAVRELKARLKKRRQEAKDGYLDSIEGN